MSDTDATPTLSISEDGWELPVAKVLAGRAFITGKSGSGKSNTASVVIEELLDQGYPVMIVDTDGEYWGLKDTYEILHVGADDECDLQVGPEHAEKLADLALVENVPIILDVSGYIEQEEADELVKKTAEQLFAKEKKLQNPFLLLVEECHEYIPEKSALSDVGKTLIRIAKRGRKRGLGICGLSQRPADVKKDFITQADWLVWHRLTWKNDTNVVRKVLGSEYADQIPDLGDGEAFVTADFKKDDVRQLQVRRKRTFDAGATPDLGDVERPDLKNVSGDLVDELEAISDREQQRQNRISQLEAELEAREKRIEELEAEVDDANDIQNLVNQMSEAFKQMNGEDEDQPTGPSEAVGDVIEERNRLKQKLEKRTEEVEDLQQQVSELQDVKDELEQLRSINLSEAEEAVTRLAETLGIDIDESAEKWRRKYKQERKKREEAESRQVDHSTAPAEKSHVDGDTTQRETVIESTASTIPDDYKAFVQHGFVKDAIERAKNSDATPRYVDGVISNILQQGGPVDRQQVANALGINTTHHIGQAMQALESEGIVELDGSGKQQTADFAVEEARKKDEVNQIMETLNSA